MPTLRMVAPHKDFKRVSVEGFVYDVDKDGEVEAHVQHKAHLEAHGFTVKTARQSVEVKTEAPKDEPTKLHPKAAKAKAEADAKAKAEVDAKADAKADEATKDGEPHKDDVLG